MRVSTPTFNFRPSPFWFRMDVYGRTNEIVSKESWMRARLHTVAPDTRQRSATSCHLVVTPDHGALIVTNESVHQQQTKTPRGRLTVAHIRKAERMHAPLALGTQPPGCQFTHMFTWDWDSNLWY